MPDILSLVNRQRAELDAIDAQNLERVTATYGMLYQSLQGDIDALALRMDEGLSTADLQRTPQYKRLVRDMRRELERFTSYLELTIGGVALAAVTYGLNHSQQLVTALGVSGFQGLGSNVITPLLDYLRRDGPLYARLKTTDRRNGRSGGGTDHRRCVTGLQPAQDRRIDTGCLWRGIDRCTAQCSHGPVIFLPRRRARKLYRQRRCGRLDLVRST